MLFVSISVKWFLKEDGSLVFLLPFPLLKTQSAAGYRALLANNCKIGLVDEMVSLKPFGNAINRPSLIALKKGRTEFPIRGNSWFKFVPN